MHEWRGWVCKYWMCIVSLTLHALLGRWSIAAGCFNMPGPYPAPQIKSTSAFVPIIQCLTHVMNGQWVWPDFQREYQWTELQLRRLIPCLLRGIPLQNLTVWEECGAEKGDKTTYKTLACAGFSVVRSLKNGMKAIVDGGHRLNALCFLLDSADEGDFVPRFTHSFLRSKANKHFAPFNLWEALKV